VTKPVSSVANTFATAGSTIPLSYLDADFSQIIGYLNDLNLYSNYTTDVGTPNVVVLNFPSGITSSSISTGTQLLFKASNLNTGATTLTVQVNSVTIAAAQPIVNEDGGALSGNSLLVGGIYSVTYSGSNWILGGGGSGSGGGASANGCIYQNNTNITSNYTMSTGTNGFSVGPITIASGVTVTVPSGQRWVVL